MGSFARAPAAPLPRLRPHVRRARNAYRRARRSDLPFAVWSALLALLLGRLVATERWQEALTIVAVLTAVAVYARWPSAGVAIVMLIWVLAPFVRRLLDYISLTFGPDLLSLTPFVATAGVALVAMRHAPPSRAALLVLALFWAALIVGTPTGLQQPTALAYGLFAYGCGSLALLIGRRDALRGAVTVQRALALVVPVIAIYAIAQALLPLTPWDDLWLRSSGFVSVGSKADGTFRPFGSLNAPATMATLMGIFLITVIAARGIQLGRLAAAAPAAAALALSSVRSAWLALAAASVLLVPLSRGRAVLRVGGVVLGLGVLYLAFGGTSAGEQVTARASTLTDVSGDTSYVSRLGAVLDLGPQAVAAPLGHGIGSVGQAARAGSTGFSELVDNGFLILLWQVGPAGFVLVFAAIGVALHAGMRGPPGTVSRRRLDLLGPVLLILCGMISGETLYGLTAVLLWYHLGAMMGRGEAERAASG